MRNWKRSANGNLTRTFDGISYTVFPDKSGAGWRYLGGGKFSTRAYPTEKAAMRGAEGSGTGRARFRNKSPGAPQSDIKRWARKMRNEMTGAEHALWLRLRDLQPRWSAQRRILGRIADFYCNAALIIVEVDGGYHSTAEQKRKDQFRDQYLGCHGVEVMRFTNDEVRANIDRVVNCITNRVTERIATERLPKSPGPRYKAVSRRRDVRSTVVGSNSLRAEMAREA